jgi:hypothetical protein
MIGCFQSINYKHLTLRVSADFLSESSAKFFWPQYFRIELFYIGLEFLGETNFAFFLFAK